MDIPDNDAPVILKDTWDSKEFIFLSISPKKEKSTGRSINLFSSPRDILFRKQQIVKEQTSGTKKQWLDSILTSA